MAEQRRLRPHGPAPAARGQGAAKVRLAEYRSRVAPVRAVVVAQVADPSCGTEDQRDGQGAKASSAASLLRSPRPELNAPMQVSAGCSPSSFRRKEPSPSRPYSGAARCTRSGGSASDTVSAFPATAIAPRVASASRIARWAARAATRRANRQAASEAIATGRIPQPSAACGDRDLPTFLRHPKVGA